MQDGKQIKDATITEAKFAPLPNTPSGPNAPTSRAYVDTQLAQSVNNQDWKNSVRASSNINVTIASPGATIGGVAMVNGDRVVLYGQTLGAANWIYNWNGPTVPMTRSLDADANSEVTSQSAVSVEEGSDAGKSFRITTTGAIVLGTTVLAIQSFVTFTSANPVSTNKFMVASVTTADGDVACVTVVTSTPNASSYVGANVNGDIPELGNGIKTKDCYFSGDSGTTARAFGAVLTGDKLYWNGSIAGYQLAATDRITFTYNV